MRPLPCQGSIATRRSVHTPSLRAASLFFVTNPILCFGLPPLRLFRFRFRFSRLIVFREIPVALCRIGIVPVHACRPIHKSVEAGRPRLHSSHGHYLLPTDAVSRGVGRRAPGCTRRCCWWLPSACTHSRIAFKDGSLSFSEGFSVFAEGFSVCGPLKGAAVCCHLKHALSGHFG